MHVVFFQDEADGELRAVVAVGDEQGPIVSSATRDVTPPSYQRIEVGGVIAAVDDFDASAFAENFVFSEPVGPESEVEVTDPLGTPSIRATGTASDPSSALTSALPRRSTPEQGSTCLHWPVSSRSSWAVSTPTAR